MRAPSSLTSSCPAIYTSSLRSGSPGYCGPVTRTMARQRSVLGHTLGVPPRPDGTPAPVSQQPTEKKRKRPSPTEPNSPLAPRQETKRPRQSSLPWLRQGSMPKSCTPTGARASPTCHSARLCPATVIKCRAPLGPLALQNCSTPLGLPAHDLNTTFDLSEEPLTLSFQEFTPQERTGPGQPFVPRWVSHPPSRGSVSVREEQGRVLDLEADICHMPPGPTEYHRGPTSWALPLLPCASCWAAGTQFGNQDPQPRPIQFSALPGPGV